MTQNQSDVRDLFHRYYGLELNDARVSYVPPPSAADAILKEELDIESIHFNPEKYVSTLLKEKSLKGLMDLALENASKSSELEAELRRLVYDNYSKFITATDTIRRMQENVLRMDHKLQSLQEHVDRVESLAQAVNHELHESREELEQKLTFRRLTKHIKFFLELPAKLRKCLNEESYVLGAQYWSAGDAVFKRHAGIESLHPIMKNCKAIAVELHATLVNKMQKICLDLNATSLRNVNEYLEAFSILKNTSLNEECNLDECNLLVEPVQRKLDTEVQRLICDMNGLQKSLDVDILHSQKIKACCERLADALLLYHSQMTHISEILLPSKICVNPENIQQKLSQSVGTSLQCVLKHLEDLTKKLGTKILEFLCSQTASLETTSTPSFEQIHDLFVFYLRSSVVRPFREMALSYLDSASSTLVLNHIEDTVIRVADHFVDEVDNWIKDARSLHGSLHRAVGWLQLCAFFHRFETVGLIEMSGEHFDNRLEHSKNSVRDTSRRLSRCFLIHQGIEFSDRIHGITVDIQKVHGNVERVSEKMNGLAVHLSSLVQFICYVWPSRTSELKRKNPKDMSLQSTHRKDPSGASIAPRVTTWGNSGMFEQNARNPTTPLHLTPNQLSSEAFCSLLVLRIFKSFIEELRVPHLYLSCSGFQQVQIDFQYFMSHFSTLSVESTPQQASFEPGHRVYELFQDVLHTAQERCLDPCPLLSTEELTEKLSVQTNERA